MRGRNSVSSTSAIRVDSERSSVVFVYTRYGRGGKPRLVQTLPAGLGPEGIAVIQNRGLLVVASEEDEREDGVRAGISIYQLTRDDAAYPTILSADRPDGTPIPWAALSGLAASSSDRNTMYAIHDSFFAKSRIYSMDIGGHPAIITGEVVLSDPSGLLAAAGEDDLVNANDMTVNLDSEGIAVRTDGGFWIASEGAGTVGDPEEPVTSANLLVRVDAAGVIEQVVTLPASTNDRQVRFGYEGVASVGSGTDEVAYVAFQREWADDPAGHVRIGRYAAATGEWTFFYYPIEASLSANGGWVGLSDLTHIDGDEFMVVERDNQAGPDAVIKRIYQFSVAGQTPLADPPAGTIPTFLVLKKTLVRDIVPDLLVPGGVVLEKVEGLGLTLDGEAVIVTDNDGVDGSNGETQFINLGEVL